MPNYEESLTRQSLIFCERINSAADRPYFLPAGDLPNQAGYDRVHNYYY